MKNDRFESQVTQAGDVQRFIYAGRALTVPESIETGLGPVCAGRQ